jgi:hypothetical protein
MDNGNEIAMRDETAFSELNHLLTPLATPYANRKMIRKWIDDALTGIANQDRSATIRALEQLKEQIPFHRAADDETVVLCMAILNRTEASQGNVEGDDVDSWSKSANYYSESQSPSLKDYRHAAILALVTAVCLTVGSIWWQPRLIFIGVFTLLMLLLDLYLELPPR